MCHIPGWHFIIMSVRAAPKCRPMSLSSSAVFCCKSPLSEPNLNTTGAMGFLSFVEEGTQSSSPRSPIGGPNAQFLRELGRLQDLYPYFPAAMMRNLLLQESGQGRVVYDLLVSRGWSPSHRLTRQDRLSTQANELFNVSYYWGKWQSEYEKILSRARPWSFCTGFREKKSSSSSSSEEPVYFVWVVNHRKQVRKWKCQSFAVLSSERKLFSLRHELERPDAIPLIHLVRLHPAS